MSTCKWLPDLFDYPDWNNYVEYENSLYALFKIEIIDADLLFRGKLVQIRWHPIENDKEEAFYHCTCKNYTNIKNRQPDPDRMIHLPWLAPLIRNYDCKDDCCQEKPLKWKKLHTNKRYRYYLYFRDYLVILEERSTYFLLITAFYVTSGRYDKDLRKDAQKTENAILD